MELQNSISKFYDAIIRRDINCINASYCKDENTYVILEGPRLSTKGYTLISKGWKDFSTSKIALEKIIWTEGPFEEITGNMGWISGIIELHVSINKKTFMNTFRASFVLKKIENKWKIRHEHVSAPHEDPYGVGDWLQH